MVQKHKLSGFTIVELLIAIVVIAILSTISIVAFNGIQARAENSKTVAAAEAYIKAIKMYEADNGESPHGSYVSCLGENYKWDFAANDSGVNQCRSTYTGNAYFYTRGSINTDLKKYITPLPELSKQTVGSPTDWVRGVTYSVLGGVGSDFVLFFGLKSTNSCPTVAGQSDFVTANLTNGVRCKYKVGTRLR